LGDVRRAQGLVIKCCCYFGPGIKCQNMYPADCRGIPGAFCIGPPCPFAKLILAPPSKKYRHSK
jgi:hypothetical protein